MFHCSLITSNGSITNISLYRHGRASRWEENRSQKKIEIKKLRMRKVSPADGVMVFSPPAKIVEDVIDIIAETKNSKKE